MTKRNKVKTPEWILEGYDSPEAYNKAKGLKSKKTNEKTFKIRECPKCRSDEVGIVLSNSDSEEDSKTGKEWECRKCKWQGKKVNEKELTEDEFMEYLDNKGEEVA